MIMNMRPIKTTIIKILIAAAIKATNFMRAVNRVMTRAMIVRMPPHLLAMERKPDIT
jgi:hypothetical protein